MPWKSKAQRDRCKNMIAEGSKGAMTQEAFDAIDAETPDIEGLPERLHPKTSPRVELLADDELERVGLDTAHPQHAAACVEIRRRIAEAKDREINHQ